MINKIYTNPIDYVSIIEQDNSSIKPIWISKFIGHCQNDDNDFAFVYKNLKEGLILQYGFETAINTILPEIIWSNHLSDFCEG